LTAKTNILSLIIITFASVFGYGQGLPFACTGSRAMYGVTGFENSVFDWAVEGGEIIENMNDTIVVEWNYSRGSHSISVVEITEYGCIGDRIIILLPWITSGMMAAHLIILWPGKPDCYGRR
jgi:hypothetical protein